MHIRQKAAYYLLWLGACSLVPTSQAATIIVNTPQDFLGQPATLVQRCLNQIPANQCSLRAAAELSTQLASADTILLPAATYTLTQGELKFFGNVTLHGVSPLTTIITNAANKKNRILNFSQAGAVVLKNMTVRGGLLEEHNSVSLDVKAFDGGAGVRAVGVSELIIDNTRIIHNTIVLKKGLSQADVKGTDKSAASGLYVEGGLNLTNGSWISQNKIVQDDAGNPYTTFDIGAIYVESKNDQQKITIQNSFVENNTYEETVFFGSSPRIELYANSINIYRSRFRNNDAFYNFFTPSNVEAGIRLAETHFIGPEGGAYREITLESKGAHLITGNTFEEIPVWVLNVGIDGASTNTLRPSSVVNNTFKMTTLPSFLSGEVYKTIAISHHGPYESVRPTMFAHNTVSFSAPVLEGVIEDTAPVFISAPTIFQNNIVHAYPAPGFMFEVFPCYVFVAWKEESPLTNLGGNLLFSPNLSPMTPDNLSCNLSVDDQQPQDPLLDDLKWNGGWTPTMALLPGSPALSAAPEPIGTSVPFDQRGAQRPLGTGRDIGAFESDGGPILED